MFNFTSTEQVQIDDMVTRIESGEMSRASFVGTTNMRVVVLNQARAVNDVAKVARLQHEIAARQIVEVRTK